MARDNYYGVPYRGSSVIIAYNSTKISNPPTTLQGLYDWIKANPGQFTYNTPDTGGSGQFFVEEGMVNSQGPDPLHLPEGLLPQGQRGDTPASRKGKHQHGPCLVGHGTELSVAGTSAA